MTHLIAGTIMEEREARAALENLGGLILHAREKEPLPLAAVVDACDALSQQLDERAYLPLLLALGMREEQARSELALARRMLSRAYIENRLRIEFGAPLEPFTPYGDSIALRQEWAPLGVLLHIAAGNVDALPLFSVIEGLLTGNINILKLPGGGDALSVPILRELIALEPRIAEYAFVFDYPSHDLDAMQRMMREADAIVVWGSDEAVLAVRRAAHPHTRIIEWGNKISFAYLSGEASDADLMGIAHNICDTSQLLCSSCQGIFVDTGDFNEVVRLAERFLPILEHVAADLPGDDIAITAQKTLEIHTEKLEAAAAAGGKRVFAGDRCSVIAYDDRALTPSYMFRNCWVRPLPREALLAELSAYKNRLQTVALICGDGDRGALERLLAKTGVVRITSGARMSQGYCGMPHDGEFSLRRYQKVMSYEGEAMDGGTLGTPSPNSRFRQSGLHSFKTPNCDFVFFIHSTRSSSPHKSTATPTTFTGSPA